LHNFGKKCVIKWWF